MKRLLPLILALSCVPEPSESSRAENASLVLMRTSVEMGDPIDGTGDTFVRVPACGAVAVSPREVVTAAHCLGEFVENVALVTREQWFTTASDYLVARVVSRNAVRDVAWLETDEDLAHTGFSYASQGRALLVRRFETDWASLDGTELTGVALRKGDSGSGAFDERGDLIAIVSTCYSEGDVCTGGGVVVRP